MSPRLTKILRLLVLAVLIVGLFALGTHPGVQWYFDLERLRGITSEAGFLGMVTFVGLTTAGYLMQLPGIIFVVAALLGWGTLVGSIMSFVGLTAATSASFWMIRSVGGSPVSDIENGWVRKMLTQLDDHPVRTVTVLRVVFFVNPLINAPLVLTDLRYRDYLLGSMIGFVIPLTVIALGTDTVMTYLVSG